MTVENILKKLIGDKAEYRAQLARVAALPEDYRFVYEKMQQYMWGFAGGSGTDMLRTCYGLIDLFEPAAADGRHVLDVTGEDVAAFCDALIQDNNLWTDGIKRRLNRRVSGSSDDAQKNGHIA